MNERNFYFSVLWTHLTIITFSKMLIDRYIVSQLFYVCSQTGSCIIICVLISTTISCVCIILSVLCKEASTKTFLIILKLRIVMFGVLQNTCQLCHHDFVQGFALCSCEINRLFSFVLLIMQKYGIRNL